MMLESKRKRSVGRSAGMAKRRFTAERAHRGDLFFSASPAAPMASLLRRSRLSRFKRFILCGVYLAGVLVMAASGAITPPPALSQSREEVREEFHQTYPLAAGGRISLENMNGAAHITSWDRNEVRVDAVKTASTPERLAEAKIQVEASSDAVRIRTKYQYEDSAEEDRTHINPASVEYTLTLPRTAKLEDIELINGALDIENIGGDVKASSINGPVIARGLSGEAKLSTINGPLEVTFDRLEAAKPIALNSVNGPVILTIPSDASAELKANTVHGAIENDFGLPVRRGRFIGNDLAGKIGNGDASIKLSNVNGRISIKHAADNRPLSKATNLLTEGGRADGSKEPYNVYIGPEVERSMREAQRAMQEAQRNMQVDVQQSLREAQRANEQAMREAQREMQRESQEIAREVQREQYNFKFHDWDSSGLRRSDRESKTFTVSGAPRVSVATFDGSITVHGWDRSEVMFTALKRARDDETMRAVRVRAEQRGAEVTIVAELDRSAVRHTNGGATVQFDVYVPRRSGVLRATSDDGRLRVEEVDGDIELRTSDGAIDVQNGRGRLRANTGDGRIRIIQFDGETDARTGDGRITLDGRFAQLSAHTGDGSILLTLPADSNAIIETHAESVINDGLAAADEGDSSRHVRRWKVGRGGNLFTLQTGDGQIVLHRADSSRSNTAAQ